MTSNVTCPGSETWAHEIDSAGRGVCGLCRQHLTLVVGKHLPKHAGAGEAVCSITPDGTFDETLREDVCMAPAIAQVVDKSTLETIGHVCKAHLYSASAGRPVLLPGVSVTEARI